jgi:hypothetical protein
VKGILKATVKNVVAIKNIGSNSNTNTSNNNNSNVSSGATNLSVDNTGTSIKTIPIHWIDRVNRCTSYDDYPISERFMKYVNELPVIVHNNFSSYNNNNNNNNNSSNSNKNTPISAVVPQYSASQCISIVYTDTSGIATSSSSSSSSNDGNQGLRLETLDIIIPSLSDYELFVTSMNDLLYLAQKELQQYTHNMQLLQFHYMCMGKDWDVTTNSTTNKLSIHEWVQLCDRLQIPVKKQVLQLLFKEECNEFRANDKLSIHTIAMLLDDAKEIASDNKDPMILLWDELVRTDPVPMVGLDEETGTEATFELGVREVAHSISAVAVLSFIRSQQKNYTASLEQITDFVRMYNATISGEQKTAEDTVMSDRLTKGRFISWLLSDQNDIVDPEYCKVGSDDMTRPLSHYWINTSHDTYLSSIPEMIDPNKWKNDFVDVFQYMAVLLRGVRCIEIDVWDDKLTKFPIVAFRHGNDTKASPSSSLNSNISIPLIDVFKVVRYFLLENPDTYPIILKIENHCSTPYQLKMANMIYEVFGVTRLLCTPPEMSQVSKTTMLDPTRSMQSLPSPESIRGKVVLLGKRPKRIKVGNCTFINDDLDMDGWQMIDPVILRRYAAYENDEFTIDDMPVNTNKSETIVVGFDENGPIRTKADNKTLRRSPGELLKLAKIEAERATSEKDSTAKSQIELLNKADAQEVLAAQLTQDAGMSPNEVKNRASKAAYRSGKGYASSAVERARGSEDKDLNDEGLEIHEILPDMVEDNQDSYAEAVQKSMEAGQMVNIRRAELLAAEQAQQRAESDLEMSRQLEQIGIDNAKKAAAEARIHQEHADVASERVEKVRELFRNSADSASSAGTVVQTAQTEATISKKRAADAEGRAARAQMAAEKDRERADEESRKEEMLEQEVSELHVTCQEATEASQAARVRLDKANAMFDRVTEQIKLIEKSTQYRKELAESHTDVSSVRHGGSFLAKHELKLEERNTCRDLMKETSEERSLAETRLIALRSKFDEKARAWRIQANIALQARRTADRSAHIADDLAEHAEEEREAAQLRQFAREKAVEAVENRSSHRQSVEAQLAEAERAATEAAEIAAQSRIRAQRLQQEIDKVGNHATFVNLMKSRKEAVAEAKAALAAALKEKEEYEKLAEDEKRRLDTNSAVYRSTAREAATDGHRIKVVQVLQQEAIVAYNTALMLRKQDESAMQNAKDAAVNAENKKKAVEHAKEYKARMDLLIEMPVLLAKSTLLHSSKFISWEKSHGSPCSVSHSFAQNVLLEMIEKDADQDRGHMYVYTRDHLCRVFPSWRVTADQSFANCDPVFAWSMGCQMVGMNFQSADENLLVADGRFRQNGSCGYVLKPRCLTDTKDIIEQQQTWTFQVLGAYNIPKIGRKVITPRVRVSLYCGSTTETRKMFKTKFARMNGINPSWDEADSVFNFVVPNPSIAMISFSVWDKCGDKAETFIAGASFPVACLREGYRSVALFNIDHSRIGPMRYASLLVRVSRR